VLARVGGDEFAILTLAVDPAEITVVARRAHEAAGPRARTRWLA